MTSVPTLQDGLELDVENLGGITETSIELAPGVTVLEGENATNRTSLLRAVMAALGSDRVSLKGDADRGRVRLSLGDTVVEREFVRGPDGVEATGEGYLDDPTVAERFAFLLADNETRRAVARGADLRELVVDPVDTEALEAEIERLVSEKRELDAHIERIDDRESDLPDLRERRDRLAERCRDLGERLDELHADIEAADAELDPDGEEPTAAERALDRLGDRRSELDDVRFRAETVEETVAALEAEREEKRDRLEGLDDADPSAVEDRLADLRARKRDLDARVSELNSVVEFNEEMLDGTDGVVASALRGESDGAVTDQLQAEQAVVCWTCGSSVARSDVEATLDRLRSVREETFEQRQAVQAEIDEAAERLSALRDTERERERLQARLTEIEDELPRKRDRLAELADRREALREDIEALEREVEEARTADHDAVLELHEAATETELELETAREDLAAVEEEIEEVEALVAEREDHEARREATADRLRELRTRVDRLEREAVEAFNDHMERVLEALEYDNIARVWIERAGGDADGRDDDDPRFDLHVVRTSDAGRAYEGTIDTFSESEREVVGLVFALAGYLVHDLHETVPAMLLDSLEAIDADRIARLLEYFADYPEFLVVALLPADAAAVDVDHRTVTDI